jgi:hypothetical protein
MADPDRTRQLADDVVAVEIAGDMSHCSMCVIIRSIEANDPRRLLAAMLEGVEAEGNETGRRVGAPDSENAALLAEFIVVKRVGGKHDFRANPQGFARI